MNILKSLFVSSALFSTSFAQTRGVFMSDIDPSANACNDFFAYSNGGWRRNNPIPASMPRWSRRWQSGENAKDRLREILLEVSAKGPYKNGSTEQLVSDFYTTCTNEALANKLGMKPVRLLLAQIKAAKNKADVQNAIARLSKIGIGAPFFFTGGQDNHDPENVIAQIYAAGLGLPDRDYYLKPEDRFVEAREKYKAYVQQMFMLAGYTSVQAATAQTTIFDLETQLAKASLDNVSLRDPAATDHKMQFADLQKLTPAFDWSAFYKQVHVTPAALNVAEPGFMKTFNSLFESAPIETWKMYLSWLVINASAPYLSKEFVNANYNFYGAYMNGSREMKPLATRCAETADNLMGEAVGKKYVEKYFSPAAKAKMQELVKNLLLAMGETIRGLEWMGPETKKHALEKLSTFKPKIGYPDKWRDYSKLKIGTASNAANVQAGIEFQVSETLSQIGRPVDRERWAMTPATSDASYNPLLNDITFPAGILQEPAFSENASDPVNYGAIGVVIGHEISHGFDDEGSKYDAQGRLHNWWTPEDQKKFEERTACVANQFENYYIEPGIHHNGKLVLGESIADLAGAKLAYLALQISRRGKPALPSIDGLDADKQFFIAWGQFRGDEVRPEFARRMVQGDPHAVAKYRVIGPLSNLLAFQKTFGCSDSSPMVRKTSERCEVW
jgi:endothelin-converting enzyme/putative endopeptidase